MCEKIMKYLLLDIQFMYVVDLLRKKNTKISYFTEPFKLRERVVGFGCCCFLAVYGVTSLYKGFAAPAKLLLPNMSCF